MQIKRLVPKINEFNEFFRGLESIYKEKFSSNETIKIVLGLNQIPCTCAVKSILKRNERLPQPDDIFHAVDVSLAESRAGKCPYYAPMKCPDHNLKFEGEDNAEH